RARQDQASEEGDPHQDAPLLGRGERLELGGRIGSVERDLEDLPQPVGEEESDDRADQNGDRRLDQPPPELFQVGEYRSCLVGLHAPDSRPLSRSISSRSARASSGGGPETGLGPTHFKRASDTVESRSRLTSLNSRRISSIGASRSRRISRRSPTAASSPSRSSRAA